MACGLAKNLTSLIVFRVLAGFVGGAPLVNAGGTIGDMISINHRGAILSLFSAVDVLAPVVGPFAGGYITSSWGWRWIFYFLAILVRFSLKSVFTGVNPSVFLTSEISTEWCN